MSQGASGGQRWRTSVGKTPARGLSLKAKRAAWGLLVFVLGGAIVWLLLLSRLGGGSLKTQVVAIGMTYDNPVFRQSPFVIASANAFDELHRREETKSQFPDPAHKHELKLDGARLLEISQDLSSLTKKHNLLVYLNLQGGVVEQIDDETGAAACFLTVGAEPKSLHKGDGSHRVLARELFAKLCENSAANVVVLLESGDCGPNWRAGILNRDFLAQLKKEIAAVVKKYPKLSVIGAVSDGETSHASSKFADERGQSAFSHFAVRGLLGEADGWKCDAATGKCTQDESRRRSNRSVSFDELFAYMTEQVGTWSKSNRAAKQTIWRLPEAESKLELTLIRPKSLKSKAANAAKELANQESKPEGKDKSAEKASPSSAGEKGKENTKDGDTGGAQAKEKSAADKEPATKEPATKESATGKSETANAATDNKSAKDGEPAKPPTESEIERSERAKRREQLLKLWSQRDAVREDKEALAAWIAPREWRRLQLELIHAEQCLRAGDKLDRIDAELAKAGKSLSKIADQVRDIQAQTKRPAKELVSLAHAGVTIARQSSVKVEPQPVVAADQSTAERTTDSEPSPEEQKQFADFFKAAFSNETDAAAAGAADVPKPSSATSPTDSKTLVVAAEPPKHAELKKLVSKYPEYRVRIWQEAFRPALKLARQAKEDGRVSAAEFAKLNVTLSLASEIAGAASLPAELVTVAGIVSVAESVSEEFPWTTGPTSLSRACGQVIDLRDRFEQFSAENWASAALLQAACAEFETKLIASERWLQVGQAEVALQNLVDAESALTSVKAQADTLRRAAKLKATVSAELPDLARWVANQLESSGAVATSKSSRKVLQRFADSRKAGDVNNAEELNELRELVKSQNETWFNLFDVIEQATDLFRATVVDVTDSAAAARQVATTGTSSFDKVAGLTNKLEMTWNAWRSFDREVDSLLSETTPNASQWSRINEVLLVPWITSSKRGRLLEQLDRLDRAESLDGVIESRSAVVARGDWQAFWAIATLHLAGLEPQKEQELWAAFSKSLSAKSDSDDSTELFVEPARLGRMISQAFASVAANADSVTTDLTARRDSIDLALGEQLTRGADAADLPSTDAEHWISKRVSHMHDEFIRLRATQTLRFAELGSNGQASPWLNVANRWRTLSGLNAVNANSPDWLPLMLGTISAERLIWSRTELPEIQFPLSVTSRVGQKRRTSIIRVLDAGNLIVDPEKMAQLSGYELSEVDEPQVAMKLQKPKSVTATESYVTIALLDKQTQFPWDTRRLTLRTPLKEQDWRIEYRTKEELANRDEPGASSRNVPWGGDKYRTVLWLPATSRDKPVALYPVLIPPPDSKIKTVSVTVFEIGENGEPRTTHSGKKENIAMNADGLPIALKLAIAAPAVANPKPAATATPAPAPAPAGKEVSRGWMFHIVPAGETKPIVQYVIPRVRPPQTYFNSTKSAEFQVRFRNRELKVELQRRKELEEIDRVLPESVRVNLLLPKALDVLRTDNQLVRTLKRGEKASLLARFGAEHLSKLNAQAFTVSLNVDGWPRAFSYRVRHDEEAVEVNTSRPIIVDPPTGSVFPVGKELPVEIQIDSERLNSFGLDEPWKLVCEMVSNSESNISPAPQELTIVRSLHESIELISQTEDEPWLLAAAVRNHRVSFDTEGLRGRFSIRATASRPGAKTQPPGAGESEKVLAAIAAPDHLPETPKLVGVSTENIRPGTKTDWIVRVSAEDPEAGVTEIAAGFDADDDGKLGEKEIIDDLKTTRFWINPLDEATRRVTLTVPAAKLPKMVKSHDFLVIAKNGVSKVCEQPLRVTLEVDKPRGWVAIKMRDLGMKDFVLIIKGSGIDEAPSAKSGTMLKELPVGEYEFRLANDIDRTKTGKTERVTITAENTEDKPASVTVNPP